MGGEREETVQDRPRKPRSGNGLIQPGKTDPAAEPGGPVAGAPIQSAAPAASLPPAGGPTRAQELLAALRAATTNPTAAPPGLGKQAVRMHESGGEIHFHADLDGLKAGVPVGEMWGAWNRLQHLQPFTWLDQQNGSLLTIAAVLQDGDELEVYVNLAACRPRFGRTFSAMRHTIGRE